MKNPLFLSIIILFSFLGCEKEPETKITTLITLTVDESYVTTFSDNWVIVHDADGEPLEFKSFENNDHIVIETEKPMQGNTVGVTIVQAYAGNGSYNVTTTLDLPIGYEMTLKINNGIADLGPNVGSFNVTLTSSSALQQQWLTNKANESCTGSGFGSDPGSHVFTCNVRDQARKYLLEASDWNGNLRYKFLENVQPNDSYNVNFDEMSEFDVYKTFTFPQTYNVLFFIMGRETDQSISSSAYMLQFSQPGSMSTSIQAGYLNALSKYSTYLHVRYDDHSLYYYNQGEIPDNISWPSPSDFSLSSKSLSNFSSTASSPFIWRRSEYNYQATVSWTVQSTSEDHTISLPSDILTEHPSLNLDNMVHEMTTFYTQGPLFYGEQPDKFVQLGVELR